MPPISFFTLLFLLSFSGAGAGAEPTADKQALLDFLSKVPHESRLQWDPSLSACSWVGVSCDPSNSSVHSLRLPGVGLIGPIPPSTLGRLSSLRVLSLRSNRLSGPLPADLSNLKSLRNVYLQRNQLSGEFPPSLAELTRLNRLDLSSNNFTGPIPFALNNLTHLTGLFLQSNGFTGKLPNLSAAAASLDAFNVSDNRLNGSIPAALAKFPSSSFANNLQLCGAPLPPCSPFFPSPAPSPDLEPPPGVAGQKKHRKLSTAAIVGISIAGGLLALLLLLALIFFLIKKRKSNQTAKTYKPPSTTAAVAGSAAAAGAAEIGTSSSKDDVTGVSGEGGERNKLVFFQGGVFSFDLEDLLRASAEVLGKGSVGTSYKAVLEEGTTVVVKRLKDVAAAKKEFEQQLEMLGNVKHPNVLPLRAYYFSKDEKLLVSDYMPAGSLSALLHGNVSSSSSSMFIFFVFCLFLLLSCIIFYVSMIYGLACVIPHWRRWIWVFDYMCK